MLLGYSGTGLVSETHTGGRGDAWVGTKVLPLCKLKPLITNWEAGEEGWGGSEMDGQRGSEREGRGERDRRDLESLNRRKMVKQAETRWNKRKSRRPRCL